MPIRYSEDLQNLIKAMVNIEPGNRPSVQDLLSLTHIKLRIKERNLRERHVFLKEKEEEIKQKEKYLKNFEEILVIKENNIGEIEERIKKLKKNFIGVN